MTVPFWSELTADQQLTLLTSPVVKPRTGIELLDFATLDVVDDLSAALVPAGGYVRWDGTNLVFRTSSFTLLEELSWDIDIVRLYRIYTDPIHNIVCRGDRAVQIVSAPAQDLASTPTQWQVTGQDRTAWLDRLIGRSYQVNAGASVLSAMRQVFIDAGIPGTVTIDPSAASKRVPTDMPYPFIAVDTTPSTTTVAALPADSGRLSVDPSSPATWRQVLSDLCGLVAYAGPYEDSSGVFQLGPYVDAALREPSFTFDASMAQIVAMPRSLNRAKPTANVWDFINTALPDVGGLPATPVLNNGIAHRENPVDGSSSIAAMKGLRFPATPIQVGAADQGTLNQIADAQVAAFKRTVQSVSMSTRSFPAAEHFQTFRYVDAKLADGPWLAEAQSWNDPLDGGRTAWTLSKVA